MQLIYEIHNQYVFDTDELDYLTIDDLKNITEDEIIEAMTDEVYGGNWDNLHTKIVMELVNDNGESESYFEKYKN